jgi:antitoxin HicB
MRKSELIITKAEKGWYTVEDKSLPGCISQGKTKEEALKNITDARAGYLQSLKKHGEHI